MSYDTMGGVQTGKSGTREIVFVLEVVEFIDYAQREQERRMENVNDCFVVVHDSRLRANERYCKFTFSPYAETVTSPSFPPSLPSSL
jgi:hypothetical protein